MSGRGARGRTRLRCDGGDVPAAAAAALDPYVFASDLKAGQRLADHGADGHVAVRVERGEDEAGESEVRVFFTEEEDEEPARYEPSALVKVGDSVPDTPINLPSRAAKRYMIKEVTEMGERR